jgi:hypothetical protein
MYLLGDFDEDQKTTPPSIKLMQKNPPRNISFHFNKRKALLLLFILIFLIFSVISATHFQKEAPNSTPTPSTTPTQTPILNPTSTPINPTLKPILTSNPAPSPTYLSGMNIIPNSGNIIVTGAIVYGGDLSEGFIKWGNLSMGDTETASFYLRSTSNVPIVLSLDESEWTPAGIDRYLYVSWNYTGESILPGNEISISMSLSSLITQEFADFLNQNNYSSFSFNVHISSAKA